MRAYVESYGCTHNHSDAGIIRGVLLRAGAELVPSPGSADLIFINTCAVKLTTEQRMLSRIAELSKLGEVVACGCLPKVCPEKARATGAILVDTDSLHRIPELFGSPGNLFSETRHNKLSLPFDSTGPSVPLQISEGCLGNCTYCGTKHARGALHSYPEEDIVQAARCALGSGARELLITSEDTGTYGKDTGTSLPNLLNRITALDGDFKVRVGMMNPEHATAILPGLLSPLESPKIYKFFHIPVQSGSDSVLQSMGRNYSVSDFEVLVSEIRKRFPEATIGTDIIVAFPTETGGDFKKTLALIKRVRPDVANTSRFSPRPGTKAEKMPQLPSETAKSRSVEMSRLARKISLENNRRYVGGEYTTVALAAGRTGGVVGRAPNYKQLAFEGVLGREYRVRALAAFPTHLAAQRIK